MIENEMLNDDKVAAAFRAVPRGFFYPTNEGSESLAYEDSPLRQQTTDYGILHQSAPHMYAMIATKLDVRPGDRFLNVGSGSGYFSAIIAHLLGPSGIVSFAGDRAVL